MVHRSVYYLNACIITSVHIVGAQGLICKACGYGVSVQVRQDIFKLLDQGESKGEGEIE